MVFRDFAMTVQQYIITPAWSLSRVIEQRCFVAPFPNAFHSGLNTGARR